MQFLISKEEGLGNVALGTPFFTLLREHYPDSTIHVMVSNQSAYELLENFTAIDRVFQKGMHDGLGKDYDVLFLPEFRSGELDKYVRGRAKRTISHPARDFRKKHEAVHCLELLEQLGKEVRLDIPPSMVVSESDRNKAIALLERVRRPFVVFHVGCKPQPIWRNKRWPLCNWIQLAKRVKERGLGVVLTGTDMEKDDIDAIRSEVPVHSLLNKTSVRVCAAVLRESSLLVCGDCGIMHLATCANVPLIALFGPTFEGKSGPWGRDNALVVRDHELACKRCHIFDPAKFSSCRDPVCMRNITVDDVLEVVEKTFKKNDFPLDKL